MTTDEENIQNWFNSLSGVAGVEAVKMIQSCSVHPALYDDTYSMPFPTFSRSPSNSLPEVPRATTHNDIVKNAAHVMLDLERRIRGLHVCTYGQFNYGILGDIDERSALRRGEEDQIMS